MNKTKVPRRKFIKSSIIGVLGFGALWSTYKVTLSQPDMGLPEPYPELLDQTPETPSYNEKCIFFNEKQYALVATLAAIIVPTDLDAGANETGVVDYLDKSIAHSPENRQKAYTRGLDWLNETSKKTFDEGNEFIELKIEEQVAFLKRIDNISRMRSRPVFTFFQRLKRKMDNTWDDLFGLGRNSRFFRRIRSDIIMAHYSNPLAWISVGYYGPPQPVGYLDFSDPPDLSQYTDSIQFVRNNSCQICHTEIKHPTGGLIDHTCKTCHRPHSPWPKDRNSFHLEDNIEFLFPSPDRNWRK